MVKYFSEDSSVLYQVMIDRLLCIECRGDFDSTFAQFSYAYNLCVYLKFFDMIV